jgi:hypothetical protein
MSPRKPVDKLSAAKLRASRFRYELVRDFGEDIAQKAIKSIGSVRPRHQQAIDRRMVLVEYLEMTPRNVNKLAQRLVDRGQKTTFEAAKTYINDARRRAGLLPGKGEDS